MRRLVLSSEKGLTLIELLVGLSLFSIVSVMIMSNLIGGMNSFKSVNKQISLQDEANYIMTQFVNHVFVASKVETISNSGCISTIKVVDRNGVETTLGFDNKQAVMNGASINSNLFEINCTESIIALNTDTNTVSIKMVIIDTTSNKRVELNNKVSYVKVE